jgi:hypothetical protein
MTKIKTLADIESFVDSYTSQADFSTYSVDSQTLIEKVSVILKMKMDSYGFEWGDKMPIDLTQEDLDSCFHDFEIPICPPVAGIDYLR